MKRSKNDIQKKSKVCPIEPLENLDFWRFFEKSEEKVKKMFDNPQSPEYNPDLCNANRLKLQANVSVAA